MLSLDDNICSTNELERDNKEFANHLTKSLWLNEYASDIFNTIKESELKRRPLSFASLQLAHRPNLLRLLQFITNHYNLCSETLHLGIYYLDRFMDRFTIQKDKLILIAITCLHLAAQIESTEAIIPRYTDINTLLKQSFTIFEYRAVERKILPFFGYFMLRPTTATFVQFFSSYILAPSDYNAYMEQLDNGYTENGKIYERYESYEQMLSSLKSLYFRMSDYTICLHRLGNHLPSLLAAAAIAAVREVSNLPQIWTQQLIKLTTYNSTSLIEMKNTILLFHRCHLAPPPPPPPFKVQNKAPLQPQSDLNSQRNELNSPDSGIGNLSQASLVDAGEKSCKRVNKDENDEEPLAKRKKLE